MSGTELGWSSRGHDSLMVSAVRRSIVEQLRALPPLAVPGRPTRDTGLTAAELGQELGLHSSTVRFHLDQLVDGGLVETHVVRSGGAGRPAKRYVASAVEQVGPEPAIEGPYQVLATVLASALDPAKGESPTPEEAGALWVRQRLGADGAEPLAEPARTTGEWVGKVGAVVDLLQEWGYTPDLEMSGRQGDVRITLRDCPFLDLAREIPEVVCGVHRGLLKGALEVAGEAKAGVSLRPFVASATCHAVLLRDRTPPGEPIEPGPARWEASARAVPADDPATPTDIPADAPGDPA
ncbi:helix-turn-helix domain-containing protein [uncultured Serinicoccus sp.]|uniref:helix-turn-helix transcriptional regulator n=1 Tax=uncultured Serinicoccus sp. TaxID=735514 RepID=UPI002622F199|nr:helix-turn-helix domain-containing protein [uncultured Serinicoccus sp.]